ncbi:Stringent starvation protein A [compost metagenome]
MSITVFGAALSPFVRKVRLFLAEKGTDYQLENVQPFTPPEWYLELNPLGRIPAMKDGELTLADSSVICHYLEERNPELAPLCGEGPVARARVSWLEKYADYEVAPLSTFTVFRNRVLKPLMGKESDETAVQGALLEKLPRHFDYLERVLGSQEYLVDNRFSLADIALVCQLVNMRHGGESVDASRWPALAAHFERVVARPAMQEILAGEQTIIAKMTAKAAAAKV